MNQNVVDIIEQKSDWSVLDVSSHPMADAIAFSLINDIYQVHVGLSGLEVMENESDPEACARLVIERANALLSDHRKSIN